MIKYNGGNRFTEKEMVKLVNDPPSGNLLFFLLFFILDVLIWKDHIHYLGITTPMLCLFYGIIFSAKSYLNHLCLPLIPKTKLNYTLYPTRKVKHVLPSMNSTYESRHHHPHHAHHVSNELPCLRTCLSRKVRVTLISKNEKDWPTQSIQKKDTSCLYSITAQSKEWEVIAILSSQEHVDT